jgi:HK97 family phage portal protein
VGLFRRSREERALPPGALALGGAAWPSWTAAGEYVDGDKALRLSAVWACVRVLSDTISSLPIDVYRDDEHIDTPPVLQEPAAGYPAHDWIAAVMQSLLLRGNAYGLITARNASNLLPTQVELVHPDRVSLSLDPEDGSVSYRISGQEFDRTDVWHVRAFCQPGAVLGMSPIAHHAETVGVGLAAQRFGAEFFPADVPVGILKPAPGGPTWDPGTTDGKGSTREQLAGSWKQYRQRRPGVIVMEGVEFEKVGVDPDDSQFLESQKFTVQQVARVYGVPPEMIASEAGGSLTYANVEQRSLDFLTYSLNPWIVRIEHALGRLLPRNQSVKLNADALLRTTTRERFDAYKVAVETGFLTIDEIRELEDLPPLGRSEPDGGDRPAAVDTTEATTP